MIENLKIRPAAPSDADALLAIRRDAILSLAESDGRDAAERWANAAPPDERQIRDAGSATAHLDASPNAAAFHARRGPEPAGGVK